MDMRMGQRSSRQLERLCQVDVAFRILTGDDPPDHTTLARFRQRHETALKQLFTQTLVLCARAGLGRFGVVAIDGTKIAANASRDATVSEATLRAQLAASAEQAVAEAGEVDRREDVQYGSSCGDELPEGWSGREGRRSRLRAALADIEAERVADEQALDRRRQQAREYEASQSPDTPAGQRKMGRPPVGADRVKLAEQRLVRARQYAAGRHREADERLAAVGKGRGARRRPVDEHANVRKAQAALLAEQQAAAAAAASQESGAGPKASGKVFQRNRTDPDSRMLPTRNGWVQGYNAQLAVTEDQLIVAAMLTRDPNDGVHFQAMMAAAQQAAQLVAGSRTVPAGSDDAIGVVVADAGYYTHANATAAGPDRLIATSNRRRLHRKAGEPEGSEPAEHANERGAILGTCGWAGRSG